MGKDKTDTEEKIRIAREYLARVFSEHQPDCALKCTACSEKRRRR